jgi:hypothetical protein
MAQNDLDFRFSFPAMLVANKPLSLPASSSANTGAISFFDHENTAFAEDFEEMKKYFNRLCFTKSGTFVVTLQ